MSIYQKLTGAQGPWIKNSEVKDGSRAKLVSETEPKEGKYGMRDVSKIRLENDSEPKNVNINKPSINALVGAFGEDSKNWVNKYLTLKTMRMSVAGRMVTALYLISEGYELTEDAGGYLVIVKSGQPAPELDPNEPEINVDEIPF